MRKLLKREKILIGLFLLLLAALFYVRLFYQPLMARLTDAQSRLIAAEEELSLQQARLIQLQNMKQSLADMKASPDFRSSLVPDYDNIKLVMVELDSILLRVQEYELASPSRSLGRGLRSGRST